MALRGVRGAVRDGALEVRAETSGRGPTIARLLARRAPTSREAQIRGKYDTKVISPDWMPSSGCIIITRTVTRLV